MFQWRTDANGWPVLVDGSLAAWLEAQAGRKRARGAQLTSSAQRADEVGRALQAVSAAAGAAGTVAPPVLVVAALAGLVGTWVRSGAGGLRATNDMDGDGRPDAGRDGGGYAPTPEEDVGRWVRGWVAQQTAPAMMGGGRNRKLPLPAAELFAALQKSKGVDISLYWWAARGVPGNRAWYPQDGVLSW